MTSREALKGLKEAGYQHIVGGWFYVETELLTERLYVRMSKLRHYASRGQSVVLTLDRVMKVELRTYRNDEDKYLFLHACDLAAFLNIYQDGRTKVNRIPELIHAVRRDPFFTNEGSTLRVRHIEVCPACEKELPKSIFGYMRLKYNAPSY